VAVAVAAVVAVAGWAVVAAASGSGEAGGATRSSSTTAPAPPTTAAPTTTSTSTTTTTTVPPHVGLIAGDSGPEVAALQQALAGLGYWNGPADGVYGFLTEQAVMAFQKLSGLGVDGNAGPDTVAAVAAAARPAPRTASGDAIEVDLEHQVVLVVRGGALEWVFNSSTGKPGWETPPGSYAVYRMVNGVDPGPYGSLYRPAYFTGGYAVHGAGAIPSAPASHGCARLTNAAMDLLWAEGLGPGMPVDVY
jgi:peptidoglycan hydrolase-like protein with peptidoglycan-binding domain